MCVQKAKDVGSTQVALKVNLKILFEAAQDEFIVIVGISPLGRGTYGTGWSIAAAAAFQTTYTRCPTRHLMLATSHAHGRPCAATPACISWRSEPKRSLKLPRPHSSDTCGRGSL